MRVKELDRYPPRYWELIQQAQDRPIFIPITTTSEARSLRNDLYNFRTQLRRKSEEDGNYEWARGLVDNLSFRIVQRENGVNLVVGRTPSVSNSIPQTEEQENE